MDSWFENTVLQGTLKSKKLLKFMNPGEMPLKTTGRYYFTHTKMAKIKGTDSSKCCYGYGVFGTFIHC